MVGENGLRRFYSGVPEGEKLAFYSGVLEGGKLAFYSGVPEGGSECVTGELVFSSTLTMTV